MKMIMTLAILVGMSAFSASAFACTNGQTAMWPSNDSRLMGGEAPMDVRWVCQNGIWHESNNGLPAYPHSRAVYACHDGQQAYFPTQGDSSRMGGEGGPADVLWTCHHGAWFENGYRSNPHYRSVRGCTEGEREYFTDYDAPYAGEAQPSAWFVCHNGMFHKAHN